MNVERVRTARVVLRRVKQKGGCEGVSCTLRLVLGEAGVLRTRAAGGHAYAAINLAVERLAGMRPPALDAGMSVEDALR